MKLPASMRLLAALILATAAAFACGSGGEPAAEAFEDVLTALADGQYGPAYDMLHPAQQDLFTKDQFITCYQPAAIPDAEVLDVEDAYDEQITVPGTDTVADSRALTVRIRWSDGSRSEEGTDTFHMWPVDDGWRWTVNEDRLRECGWIPA